MSPLQIHVILMNWSLMDFVITFKNCSVKIGNKILNNTELVFKKTFIRQFNTQDVTNMIKQLI